MLEQKNLLEDVENVGKISIVPNILNVVCQTTGMGFAAVARVTETNWTACSVRDDISFGLKPGDGLQIETTICNEIRQSGKAVIIDHVSEDKNYKCHHTPLQYGFQSYISVPIFRKDHSFFGTLCAVDPNPHKLNTPRIVDMFHLFADLISFHLDVIEELDSNKLNLKLQVNFNNELEKKIKKRTSELKKKNEILLNTNKKLQEFNYISSHDLQEPLRKIQTFVSIIQNRESLSLSKKSILYFNKIRKAAERMQLLINDLLTYSQTDRVERKFEFVDLNKILTEVLEDLKDEIEEKSAQLKISEMYTAELIPFQMRQLFYNIIGNSLKYSSEERTPIIEISSQIIDSNKNLINLPTNKTYYQIIISDNGIGFSQQYGKKIFEVFQRLHNNLEFDGTGIGLAIVKKIVENHQGIIEAKGTVNEGAEFIITFPTRVKSNL